MAPLPQESPCMGEENEAVGAVAADQVVITGMSGLYPESNHVKQLSEILYNKVNPVTNEGLRWKYNHPEVSDYTGKVPQLDRFDAQFFKVNYRMASCMDTMSKKLLEQAYQAIYDAGVSPAHLSGKKVGVYIGNCFSEVEKSMFYSTVSRTGFGIMGCSRTMFANRISYWLNLKGPSLSIDQACCSSLTALEQAYLAMSRGECEAAIVGGSHLCLHPQTLFAIGRAIPLSMDGKTRSFDQNAEGCASSEAINVLFLQKAKDALRIYAELLHVQSVFDDSPPEGIEPKYGFYRDPENMANFINNFYEKAGVAPQAVEYIDAFGSGSPQADKAELEAIEKIYCKNRTDSLLVGSVMSNIGYTEAASGIASVTKVLLGYHTGQLAANLHCETPRQDIEALSSGRMRIVTENSPFRRTYTAINSISAIGGNAHVLLHGYYKPKDPSRYSTSIPRLVTISGRQESAVQFILDELKSRPIDPEELALLHNIHSTRISGHLARGFTVIDTNGEKTESLSQKVEYYDDMQRPLWYVYSGMGSQWAGMGAQLMRIPVFAAAIERCHKVLKPKGIDIVHIITTEDKAIFDNILHSFVGIAAIQIGLTDVLSAIGLVPDKIIGHSVGELGCSYVDGCLTAEETILAAYSRGLVSVQTPFILGSMAAVGMGYEQIIKLCPPAIQVACHNGPESCTISGPADVMREFVAELTAKQIFAKEVPCSNIAYHSRYIADAAPGLLKYLKEVIKDPKPRSERWLSTSVPQSEWDQPAAKYCSAEYHTNNLLCPVLFEETSRLVPADAVLVEIAPHGLLQAILKRSLPASCNNIALTKRGHDDNVRLVLEAVGNLYMAGYTPKVDVLYPKVDFPVSTGTPFLSHLVKWAHHEDWPLPLFISASKQTAAVINFVISIHDDEHFYLRGNKVKGKMMYPFSAALVAAWDSLAMTLGVPRKEQTVHFSDVHLYAQPELHEPRQLRLSVTLHRGTGKFEIMNNSSQVATGYIVRTLPDEQRAFTKEFENSKEETYKADEIYQTMYERDYSYSGDFRSIHKVNKSLTEAEIVWSNNWVTFLDGILQLNVLRHKHEGVSQVCHFRSLCINTEEHLKYQESISDEKILMKAYVSEQQDFTRCGGILISNMRFRDLPLPEEQIQLQPVKLSKSGLKPSLEKSSLKSGFTLKSSNIGDLNSLHWVEMSENIEPGVMVTVNYASINNVDVQRATGVIPFKNDANMNYGMDFSGVTESGERVMGIVSGGAASSRVSARSELLWPVPAHWSLEDAATVPLPYAHAFYCLGPRFLPNTHGNINILVHGGAGALGQATISIALGLGYTVFTTVSDMRKKHFLRKLFPELKEDHIGNSRDHTFSDMVLSATNGVGCNVVISCLKGDLKNVSLKCCSVYGAVYDTVQLPCQENFSYGMNNMFVEKAYYTVDFSSIFRDGKSDMKVIQKMLSEGIARGYVRPLSRVTFEPHDVPRAFRLMAVSGHRGRVLLNMQAVTQQAQPRLSCTTKGSHVIICDDGLLGMKLADRLVHRGARNVHLHFERPPANINMKQGLWENIANVQVSTEELKGSNDVIDLLKSALRLGPVEGIYIAVTATDATKLQELNNVVTNLDMASRKFCPTLRSFAVLTTDNFGLQTCLTRVQDRLPASLLYLPIQNIEEPHIRDLSWYRTAVEATEQALRSTDPVLMAKKLDLQSSSLLNQLVSVAGIEIHKDAPNTATLEDLGLQCEKLQTVSTFLRDVHNVCLFEDTIMSLTIQQINTMDKEASITPFENLKGLETFFSKISADELLATTELVCLPSLASGTITNDSEFDVSESYLYIIPGMEGHHEKFQTLCERLKLRAVVIQPGFDDLQETLQDTAERLVKLLLKRAGLRDNFYLLGYESGILVALEIVSILEKQGLTGTLFCLGGGPDEIVGEIGEQVREYKTEEQLKDAVMRHMYTILADGNTARLDDALHGIPSWQLKLEVCVRTLLGRVPHSAQYVRSLIESAYAQITRVLTYTAQPQPLRSQIILLRAAINSVPSPKLPTLMEYSQHPIKTYQLMAPLAHCSVDLQTTSIINKHLDQELLDLFEQKNMCETYIVDANNIMSYVLLEDVAKMT